MPFIIVCSKNDAPTKVYARSWQAARAAEKHELEKGDKHRTHVEEV